MSVLVLDPDVAKGIRAARVAAGSDRWDEVWDGVYVVSPLPNNEHQKIVAGLIILLETVIGIPGLGSVFPGVNVSDQKEDWAKNYRCPDIAVVLRGGSAIDRETYWYGGPDFVVEIVSPEDRVHEKIPFYAKVGVRELLVIDRDPWTLELYRLDDDVLSLVGTSTQEGPRELESAVVPLTFRMASAGATPRIEVTHAGGAPRWTI